MNPLAELQEQITKLRDELDVLRQEVARRDKHTLEQYVALHDELKEHIDND